MTNTICPECGSTFDPSAGFCPKCGREVKATQSPKTYQVPDKSPEELMAVGFNHMADGSYDEGLACWNKAVDGGIVPDDENIVISTNQGEPLVGNGTPAGTAFQNICHRVLGKEVPFPDYSKSISFWTRVTGIFHRV